MGLSWAVKNVGLRQPSDCAGFVPLRWDFIRHDETIDLSFLGLRLGLSRRGRDWSATWTHKIFVGRALHGHSQLARSEAEMFPAGRRFSTVSDSAVGAARERDAPK